LGGFRRRCSRRATRSGQRKASALILILSELKLERRGEIVDNVSHSFDTGAAWANFAHQALLLGWHTHGIGGFDREGRACCWRCPKASRSKRSSRSVGKGARGRSIPNSTAGESPNGRRPLAETVFAGSAWTPAFAKERDAA
jgi:hypothetical protein